MSYLKPQTPLQHKDGDYFYPLTTIDQIIMEDGVTRLNGADLISVNTDGAPEGETAGINADTLGGYAADAYIRQDSSKALLSIDLNEIVNGTASPTNADMLGNVPAEEYARRMELLWENASLESAFDWQSISLDLSLYERIKIAYYDLINDAVLYITGELEKGRLYCLNSLSVNTEMNNLLEIRTRRIFVSDNHVEFMSGFYSASFNASGSSYSCVPFRIYGIKGVSA